MLNTHLLVVGFTNGTLSGLAFFPLLSPPLKGSVWMRARFDFTGVGP